MARTQMMKIRDSRLRTMMKPRPMVSIDLNQLNLKDEILNDSYIIILKNVNTVDY